MELLLLKTAVVIWKYKGITMLTTKTFLEQKREIENDPTLNRFQREDQLRKLTLIRIRDLQRQFKLKCEAEVK